MDGLCVIVDGYSSGKFYPRYFHEAGYRCLHVQSRPDIPEFARGCFCDSAYVGSALNTDIEATLGWIADYGIPDFVIPGCETGVTFADELSARLGTPFQNGAHTRVARRDKFLMTQTIRAAGLRGIRQERCTSAEEAISWVAQEGLEYPVVVKPLESTSGDGFSLCYSPKDIRSAFERNLGRRNLLNIQNTALLAQEYVTGVEYVVDTVGSAGVVIVSDVIRYGKRIGASGHSVYEYCDFLSTDDPEVREVVDYTCKVVEALGIVYGPAHAEVILDAQGPVLVEVGARPAGCMLEPEFITNAYGHNQIQLSALSYTAPEAFRARAGEVNKRLRTATALAFVVHDRAGHVTSVNFDEVLGANPAFYKVDTSVQVGQPIWEPKHLSETFATVYLQGDAASVETLKKDIVSNPDRYVTVQ